MNCLVIHGGVVGAEIEIHRFIALQGATMAKVLDECPDLNLEELKALVDKSGKTFIYIIT